MNKFETVFIIDDDLMQNEIHSILIRKVFPDIHVIAFSSAEAAIKAIDTQTIPDIVFLDLHLPGESETAFLNAHEERKLCSDIYLMSALEFLQDQSLFDRYSSVKDFISKPLLEYKIKHIFKQFA